MINRLSKQDWLDFALKELKRNGHSKLTANRLASELGVSRGSFYWHFNDVRDFEKSLLKRWSELTTDEVIEQLRPLETPRLRLITLVKLAMSTEMKLERSVRSWATSEKMVAKIVHSVDARRVAYIESILEAMGVASVDIKVRAQMLYWASIGRWMLSERGDRVSLSDSELNRFVDLLIS